MRDFEADKHQEQSDTRTPELHRLLKILFPDARSMRLARDLHTQKSGIDAFLNLADGKTLTIDFKFRKENYGDFCLEFEHIHDDGRVTPGWVDDDSKICDFFAYVQKKNWTCWLLPRGLTQLAWRANRTIWLAKFIVRKTRNKTYWTHWCAVPIDALESNIGKIKRVSLADEDLPPSPVSLDHLVRACHQCNKKYDGSEREILVGSFLRWLHPSCESLFMQKIEG